MKDEKQYDRERIVTKKETNEEINSNLSTLDLLIVFTFAVGIIIMLTSQYIL